MKGGVYRMLTMKRCIVANKGRNCNTDTVNHKYRAYE